MPFENTYITNVKKIHNIFYEPEKCYLYKGKWNIYFSNNNPIILEIGTGMGNFFGSLVQTTKNNYIGLEIKRKRLFYTHKKCGIENTSRFALLKDFGQNIDKIFGESEIRGTYIYFPDPWTKKENQRKNQLITTVFLEKLFTITDSGGFLEIKTDDALYFSQIQSRINDTSWKIIESTKDYEETSDTFTKKNITEFEGIWRGKNKKIGFIKASKY